MYNKIEKIEKKATNLKWTSYIIYASSCAVYALVSHNTDLTDNLGLNWETLLYISSGSPLIIISGKIYIKAEKIQERVDKIKNTIADQYEAYKKLISSRSDINKLK